MLELVKKELQLRDIPFSYLTGQTTNRSKVVEQFQNDDQIRVFLISLKAGGIGLNLTQADYVYLIDPWWNPAVENQAIDRVYRIGQQKNVVAVRLNLSRYYWRKNDGYCSLINHIWPNDLIKLTQNRWQR
nr:superfamily II DNA/RNA helicase, SNF2 family [uncultured bacterium]